ncbi:hypothetical protein AB3M93_14075 [Novosphingobium panipatense]|jgi:hypothetical protein|uniref:hypothetical protein n=1 Tax=Novosphingobium TaxID=165696 RepID=UPI000CDAFB2F|nr:hypothetical protein [Novosphingobium sp. HII-3]
MRTFTKIIAPAVVAALGFTAVTPAIAEAAPRHQTSSQSSSVRAEISGLRAQIDRAAARRTISQREATNLRRDAAQVQKLYTSYARNGLSRQETRTLQNRVDRIKAELRADRRDQRR